MRRTSKWGFVLLLILTLTSASCAHRSPANAAYSTLEIISAGFIDTSNALYNIHQVNLTNHVDDSAWWAKAQVAHDKAKLLIDSAWAALHAASLAGNPQSALDNFNKILADASTALEDLKAFEAAQ